jgi:hypothetical protein
VPGCWLWSGSYFPSGYGQVWSPALRRGTQAHRFVYETLVGPIGNGLTIDHLCRVRGCVNPAHLRVVPIRQNIFAPGSTCPAAINAAKTHCPQGHAYDAGNTYAYKGRRICLSCNRAGKQLRRISARRNRPASAAVTLGMKDAATLATAFSLTSTPKPECQSPESDKSNRLI